MTPPVSAEPAATVGASSRRQPASGKAVVLSVLAIGLTLVLGVGAFAALTRPPHKVQTPAEAAAEKAAVREARGW